MTKTAKKPTPSPRVRPIGDARDNVYEIELGPDDIVVLHGKLLDALDHREEIKGKLAEVKKDFASRLEANDGSIETIRRQIRSGRERRTVRVQDWLTKANEIVTVALASGLEIGEPRTATAAELQEEMPFDTSDADDDADGSPFDEHAEAPAVDSTLSPSDRAALAALPPPA